METFLSQLITSKAPIEYDDITEYVISCKCLSGNQKFGSETKKTILQKPSAKETCGNMWQMLCLTNVDNSIKIPEEQNPPAKKLMHLHDK